MPRLERTDRIALGASLAAAFALRVWDLGGPDLWSDEVHTFDAMALAPGEMVAERLRAGHAPLWFLLLRGWTAIFGESQFALRLPSALLGTIALLPAFALFRRVLPQTAARWALALVAVQPLFVELSREARMYPLLLVLLLVLAEGAFAALDEGRAPLRFWVAAAAGPLVHATWAFALPPLAFVAWAEGRRTPERAAAARKVVLGCAASLVLLLGTMLFAEPQRQELTRRPWPAETLTFLLRPHLGTAWATARLPAAVPAFLWIFAVARGVRAGEPRVLRLGGALLLAVPSLSFAIGVAGGLPWGPARYLQAAALGACLLAAAGLRRGGLVHGAALVVASACMALLALPGRGTLWRDAAARLRREIPPGDAIVTDEEASRLVLRHYLGRDVGVGEPPPGTEAWRVRRVEPSGVPWIAHERVVTPR